MRNFLRKVVNYFAKKLHHGFPTEFYTHFIFIDTNLKTYIFKPIWRKQLRQYQ